MQYLEPSRLYFKVGTRGLKEVVRRMSPEDDSYLDIRACLNTLEGAFDLVNQLATIVVERAKVVSPGYVRAERATRLPPPRRREPHYGECASNPPT